MYLVGYLYEDHHDARSLEHKVLEVCITHSMNMAYFIPNLIWHYNAHLTNGLFTFTAEQGLLRLLL
jgi:hypothetical protein